MNSRQLERRKWAGYLFHTWQALILVTGLLGLIAWLPMIGQPFPGVTYQWNRERMCYVVFFETGLNWPGIQAGLRINDRIVSINGHSAGDDAFEQAIRQLAVYPPEKRVLVYEVERQGQHLTVSVPLTTLTLDLLLDAKLPITALGLSYLLLAVLVYRASPGEGVNRVFAVGSTLAASICLSVGYAGHLGRSLVSNSLPILFLWEPAWPLCSAIVWHFGVIFPERNEKSWLFRLRRLWYMPGVLGVLFNLYQHIIPNKMPPDLTLAVLLGTAAWLATGLLVGGMRMILTFFRSQSRRTRMQAGAVLAGWCFGIMLPISPLLVYFLNQDWSMIFGNNLFYLGLLFPLAVAYAILRYDLFRSKTIILALFILAGFSVLAANGIYYLFNYLLGWSVAFLPLLLACAVTGVAWEVRSPLRRLFDRLFLRPAHNYQTLSRFSEALLSVPLQITIFHDVCRILTEQMGLTYAAYWSLDAETTSLQQAAHSGAVPNDHPACLSITGELWRQAMGASGNPVRGQDSAAQPWVRAMPFAAVAVYVPLLEQKEFLGTLLIGPRWNEEPFDDEDLALLTLMARQASLVLLAVRQMAELRQIPHRIAEVQEQERYEISKDLHDTVQQFLAGLPLYLEMVKRSLDPDSGQAIELLDDCQDRTQRASQDLRTIRQSLSPGPLKGGELTTALRTLVDLLRTRGPVRIALEIEGDVEDGLSPESKVALYRVVQQALDNVLAHAQGKQVEVTIACRDGRVRFAIVDDGCGFDVAQAMHARKGGHDGLWIMHDRIEMVGGKLTIKSAIGEGTTIQGWVPCAGLSESSGQ